jgi:hypothetical protein
MAKTLMNPANYIISVAITSCITCFILDALMLLSFAIHLAVLKLEIA